MKEGVKYSGVISKSEYETCKGIPSEERLKKGRVAVIECVQEIPCNPCEDACKLGAIRIGENITNTPVLIEEKCSGCGMCIAKCPGLAITVIDKSNGDYATIDFPFEYLPLPKEDDIVDAVDREGRVICKGEVVSIKCHKSYDKTNVISIKIPIAFANEVRSIKRLR